MTAKEIQQAVNEGKTVHYQNDSYKVVKSKKGFPEWVIEFVSGHRIGLTWDDGVTLNGNEKDFYIKGGEEVIHTNDPLERARKEHNHAIECLHICERENAKLQNECNNNLLLANDRELQLKRLTNDYDKSLRILGDTVKRYEARFQTYYEVVAFITTEVNKAIGGKAYDTDNVYGTQGLYQLASEWTNQFQEEFKATDWSDNNDFWLTIEKWLEAKNFDNGAFLGTRGD